MGSAVLVEPGVPERLSIAEELLPEDYIVDTLEAVQGAGIYVRGFTWNGQRAPNRTVNFGDGKGPRELNAVYCASPPGRAGTWMSMAYMTTAPVQVAAEERATLGAILQSFNVDNTVIQAEAARIAAPAGFWTSGVSFSDRCEASVSVCQCSFAFRGHH